MSTALSFGEKMKGAVDAIPFENERTGLIIKALLTGEKSGIPNDVTQAFRNSGASHILALSGLHLGIIYAIVRFITRLAGNSRKAKYLRSAVIIFICGFYTLATGAGPSIVRAFIFITIGECARLSGRSATLKRILMISLLIHLSITPSAIKEVSFQLSYAAIAGIAYIFPWLQGFWPGDRHEDAVLTRCARWIWDSAAMSISCQITTGPLAYIYFGTFPTQFILTNMIVLPLTGIIIPMALITLAACSLGWNIDLLIKGTEWMVTLLCGSLDLLSTM
jgi:competence protein ComEC